MFCKLNPETKLSILRASDRLSKSGWQLLLWDDPRLNLHDAITLSRASYNYHSIISEMRDSGCHAVHDFQVSERRAEVSGNLTQPPKVENVILQLRFDFS